MKFSIGDKVVHYGRKGIIKDMNPAARKYLVEFGPGDREGYCPVEAVYESELTKIEEAPAT